MLMSLCFSSNLALFHVAASGIRRNSNPSPRFLDAFPDLHFNLVACSQDPESQTDAVPYPKTPHPKLPTPGPADVAAGSTSYLLRFGVSGGDDVK